MSEDTPSEVRSKVGWLIAEYDMTGVDEELERRWTTDSDERWSLRELADWFNKRLLETALLEAGETPIDQTIETTYRILTDEDASTVARTQTVRDLERQGVDVDDLLDQFVSHQAIHTYLTKYRDASVPEGESTVSVEKIEETINRLQSRTAAVTGSNVERLHSANEISVGDIDVLVNVEILCSECGASYSFGELVENGGCECD